MKKLYKPRIRHLLIAGLLVATCGIIVLTRNDTTNSKIQTGSKAAADQGPSTNKETQGDTDNNKSDVADQKPTNNNSTEQPQSDDDAKSTSPACAALTAKAAQQILGQKAVATDATDTTDLATTNTSISACAYTNGTTHLQVTVRTPTDSLGISKNATVFGSGRPANAVGISGLGQAAFWDTEALQLNVLHGNIWYLVDLGDSGTQSAAETAANQLAVKL